MNLAEIRTFLAILDTGRLNSAARQLNVTQSTVTARLNNLEQEIGQTLFHRRKSGAELTSAGFRFERYAQLMVELWRQARQETALPPSIDSIVNLGCHPDLWTVHGRKLERLIRESVSNVAMTIWSGEQPDLDRWLGNGLIDVAICHNPGPRDGMTEHRIALEKLVLVSTTKRKLMRWDPEYVYVDGGEEFRKNHAAAYPDGDTPTRTFGSAVWALGHLLENRGSGYLPFGLIENEIATGVLHPVPGAPVFERNVYLIVNNTASAGWGWTDSIIKTLSETATSQ